MKRNRTFLSILLLILSSVVFAADPKIAQPSKKDSSVVEYKNVTMVSGIEFRWINNAGFEIILPNGKHVLIDPWLDSAKTWFKSTLSVEKDLDRADYIVLSHIHSDHADDVGLIQKKFPNVRIFVGALSAEYLIKWQNLNMNKIYLCNDGQTFQFDDVTIKVFAGRHTEGARGNFLKVGKDGFVDTQTIGSMELFNFLITASDGTKVMVWAGTPSEDLVYSLKGTNPDVAVMHVSPKQDFDMFGRLVASMNAKIVIPHHYDIWESLFEKNPEMKKDSPLPPEQVTVPNILGIFRKSIEKGSPQTYFFIPENHKWYHLGLGVVPSK
ncbi:MAG: MBL fold metallo-hydrolase [Treponemataceae bacterium]